MEIEITAPAVETPVVETPVVETPKVEAVSPESLAKMQKRIDRVTWENKELQRRLDAQARPESKTPASETLKAPTLADHDFDESKLAAAQAEYTTKVAQQAARDVLKEDREQMTVQEKVSAFKKAEDEFSKLKPDYREKVYQDHLAFTTALVEVIRESPIAAEVAYYLAENEEKLEAISKLPSVSQAREIGRIEAQLEAKRIPPAPKLSEAPPPVPKIDATDSTRAISSTDPDSHKLSDAEWVKAENRRLANKRKANK